MKFFFKGIWQSGAPPGGAALKAIRVDDMARWLLRNGWLLQGVAVAIALEAFIGESCSGS